MNLLLIDDDLLLRSQIKLSCEELYNNIFEAATKDDAFELAEKYHIDIALVDLYLNEPLDGQEIIQRFANQNIKTIIFSANQDQQIIKELVKDGIFDYLFKPIDIPTLHNALERAILFKEKEKELAEENFYQINQCVDATNGIKNSLTDIEKELLIQVLKQNEFNIYKTAKLLNMKRENIYYFLKKYNINRESLS